MDSRPRSLEFEVEASLLVNEGGLCCAAVIFARPLSTAGIAPDLGANAFLEGARVTGLDPVRAALRGPGLVAFVLEDPMDARRFKPGDVARLERR
jgi:hypothetical protein